MMQHFFDHVFGLYVYICIYNYIYTHDSSMFLYIMFAGRMMNQALIFPKPTNQITNHLHLHKLFSSKVTLTKIAQDLELSEERQCSNLSLWHSSLFWIISRHYLFA